jgi:long-chain acyl-CoA synthetase
MKTLADKITHLRSGLPGLKKKDIDSFFLQLNQVLKKFDPDQKRHYDDLLTIIAYSEYRDHFASTVEPDVLYRMAVVLLKQSRESAILAFLDIVRSSAFLKRLQEDSGWSDLMLSLMATVPYTFPKLFRHRVQSYHSKILFTTIKGKDSKNYSWQEIADKVMLYARGLLQLMPSQKQPGKIAFLCENSLEMVLFDLACLSTGIVNIMIPVNSVQVHIEYILKKTQPQIVIVSNQENLNKILQTECGFPSIRVIINLSGTTIQKNKKVLTPESLLANAKKIPQKNIEQYADTIRFDDLATIMFTSGTTGNPKGIMFSHKNIVYKRFARAMALPEIGEDDIFLAYLPLYHTFGRWLEMTGTIFWGARYIFMENPAPDTIIENMQRFKPTVFISIPKKWYQLYERITAEADLVRAEHQQINRTVKKYTGGNLQWGLSAAGHLDPEIFQFFQRFGIEVMSGFGMTEATGGITMTRPGTYLPGSLGKALPGIEIKLEADGELFIRGPYVMMGYFNPDEDNNRLQDGWLPTGDIMRYLDDGAIQLVDRKKEIYKNIKGETIAPQKIENYFRDFEFIRHVFLVGDHKPYNTLLIYPNYESEEIDFTTMSPVEIRTYFSSIVESVNRFLAPYERIVNFAIIDRDFSIENNELTAKGSYRRKIVEQNFASIIGPMYSSPYISITRKNKKIRIPNWFLREHGITMDHIKFADTHLVIEVIKKKLPIKFAMRTVQIGSFSYATQGNDLDLAKIFTAPAIWLGNQEIVDFCGNKIYYWYHTELTDAEIAFKSVKKPAKILSATTKKVQELAKKGESTLEGMHLAATMVISKNLKSYQPALNYLKQAALSRKPLLSQLSIQILLRVAKLENLTLQRLVFRTLLNIVPTESFLAISKTFLDISADILNEALLESICDAGLKTEQLTAFFELIEYYYHKRDERYNVLFKFLALYGTRHPVTYQRIRAFLVACQLKNNYNVVKEEARKMQILLRDGFRRWLGARQKLAVDVETGEEYKWDDVIIFEEGSDKSDVNRIRRAIKNSALIREAVFIFSNGVLIRLHDIPPGGVWISLLGKRHGKAVYRVSIQTRFQGSYDLAINLNQDLTSDEVLEEIRWLIQTSTMQNGRKLAENFGGHWEEFNLWTEEFIPGETAGRMIRRLLASSKDEVSRERICELWPFFIWAGIAAYANFWLCTGKRMVISDPSPENLIIPSHDYQVGTRIISISARKKYRSARQVLRDFCTYYIQNTEEKYPQLKGIGRWKYVFSGILEALGSTDGIAFLKTVLPVKNQELAAEIKKYCSSVTKSGFIPRRLYFAIQRFQRWHDLNKDATSEAKAAMLQELHETYKLRELEKDYPEVHTRLLTDTVFRSSGKKLKRALNDIITHQRSAGFIRDYLTQTISQIQKEGILTDNERYFLTRLPYPHLAPDDKADIIAHEAGGAMAHNLMVQLQDYEGKLFYVREAVNPKEITRLHQLFLQNNLAVQFRSEHHYLLAVNDRGYLIGGLFYLRQDQETVHIEKIVVGEFYRKKGVSDGILREFFKRMKVNTFRYITTGFFRPEYFYRFGFKIERKYAGLVKDLRQENA